MLEEAPQSWAGPCALMPSRQLAVGQGLTEPWEVVTNQTLPAILKPPLLA